MKHTRETLLIFSGLIAILSFLANITTVFPGVTHEFTIDEAAVVQRHHGLSKFREKPISYLFETDYWGGILKNIHPLNHLDH